MADGKSIPLARKRNVLFTAVTALAVSAILSLPIFDRLQGLSIDILTGLRWRLFAQTHTWKTSPAVVVALDEETYRSLPFAGTPSITWTGAIGHVLNAVIEGGAKVVGFDLVFPTSLEQSEIKIGDTTLGERARGLDRDFLRALSRAAASGQIVLGEAQHGNQPITPSPGQRIAVGHQRNIRTLNVYTDPDDVVRRVPLTVVVGGVRTSSMSLELASRALGVEAQVAADRVTLADYQVPQVVPNTLTLNFGGGDDIPTYSFADLNACAGKAGTDFFRRHFEGKVVIIGTALDLEDRVITSKRFATAPENSHAERCQLPAKPNSVYARESIPGVYVHATAVNNLLRRDAVSAFGRMGSALVSALLALCVASAALTFAPIGAAIASGAIGLGWIAIATVMFRSAFSLPLIEPLIAGLLALAATIAYRFMVADKDKRLLRKSFGLYLAPAIVEKMLASSRLPALGGETRSVTVFFSDVAGFSSLAEAMSPADLVLLMNKYLSAMTEIIEVNGGFVDKYIGDAIVAVFGAPLDDPDHARNAVRAALACRGRLEELNEKKSAFRGYRLDQRIGLNSGEALVGNIGSERRFNYTAMGDTVNLASRLEGANKVFGTSIIASESTVLGAGSDFVWRELDAIRVKGRAQSVKIYEPFSMSEARNMASWFAAYAEALALWRARDFETATHRFEQFSEFDRPSALFAERARKFALQKPGSDWEPIHSLEGN
jgi:adenylate cyclase